MVASVVTALVLALVAGARAEQYAGGAPPLYAAAEYDEERAPDAPPALHYTYDEAEPEPWEERRDRVRREPPPSREPPPRREPAPRRRQRARARRPSHEDYGYEEDRAGRRPRERVFAPAPLARTASAEPPPEERQAAEEPAPADSEDPDEWSAPERPRPSRSTPAAYPDYREYYDSRKLASLETQIPNLLRRTTTAPPLFQTHAGERPPPPPQWSARRAGALPPALVSPPRTPDTPPPAPLSTAATDSPVALVAEPAALEAADGSASLAERSRLSILRKAQRKESAGAGTSKPPVLLQVTSRPPTVVMMEAGGGRRREVSGDSADTLAKVKRLMRQKLVAGAGSVRELAAGWDDTVCDYIDVSLLEASRARAARPAALLALLAAAWPRLQ